ncbi:MAG: histidine phosphatase family protein [Acidobacteria bacterium]|nr:histidine phosphatase family protein [Acidobacteriota bacterium]
MTRIVLVRHGETVWHAENRYAGRTDVALTETGRAQARQLAMWAKRQKFDAVWSSPLSRARQTAQPSADALAVPLQIEERLIELDFGDAEGLTSSEMQQQFPSERKAFELDPAANPLPGGESPGAAAMRGEEALRAIASRSPDGRVLVVAHSTLLRLILCRLMGIPLSHYRVLFPHFDNCSITEIGVAPSGATALFTFNVPLSPLQI